MRLRLIAVLILFAACLGLPAPVQAAGAESAIRQFNDRLLDVMKTGTRLGFKGRVEKLRPAIIDVYDMKGMTNNTLGAAAAAKLTPEESARLIEAYTAFSVATYASQFTTWNGETFEMGETRPSTGGTVIVGSWIVPRSGQRTAIDYVMREVDGKWKVIDVLYEGTVSQVAVRRSEFSSILRNDGLAGLMSAIDKQTASLGRK
ncbi:ABC transporter substrate-binding protein [Magnetospirillum sp. SS-4]|uniref:ABC transporter substrate-binding protein n=1 Tax=Magnetospirillum sp. SS-4 TaxID=2681465 RepID=UPI00138336E8|nr:ABC transporter substrate-binding protein [Magnetospirillum sp. SS-4]CAA7619914.1 ABC-type transport system protein [Magnetospirillum sp. SS-4]